MTRYSIRRRGLLRTLHTSTVRANILKCGFVCIMYNRVDYNTSFNVSSHWPYSAWCIVHNSSVLCAAYHVLPTKTGLFVLSRQHLYLVRLGISCQIWRRLILVDKLHYQCWITLSSACSRRHLSNIKYDHSQLVDDSVSFSIITDRRSVNLANMYVCT